MSNHAAVKEEHRKLYRSLLTEGDPEWRIQLLADFERDARVKEAEHWHFQEVGRHDCAYYIELAKKQSIYPAWDRGLADCERIEKLKRGEL